MDRKVQLSTPAQNGLNEIIRQVEAVVAESGIRSGMVNVYAQGATAAIMIGFSMIGPFFALSNSEDLDRRFCLELRESNRKSGDS